MSLIDLLIASVIIGLFLLPPARDTSDADYLNDFSERTSGSDDDPVEESINGNSTIKKRTTR